MNDQLLQQIQPLLPELFPDEVGLLFAQSRKITLSANENFINEGQIPKKFGFVVSGLLRYFYTDARGREFTKMFIQQNSFVTSYTAMIKTSPSFFTIQALVDSEVLEISYDHWLKVRQSSEKWNFFLISLLEKAYAIKEKRERELLILDAESRYKIFREEFKVVENSIKQNLIASYIGITPIALSRIRNKMGLINIG